MFVTHININGPIRVIMKAILYVSSVDFLSYPESWNSETTNVLMILIPTINAAPPNIYRAYCVIIFFSFIPVICRSGFSTEYAVNVKGTYLKPEKSCKPREMR